MKFGQGKGGNADHYTQISKLSEKEIFSEKPIYVDGPVTTKVNANLFCCQRLLY